MTNKTIKLVSFIIACVMLAVAMLVLNILQALAYGFLSLVSLFDSPLLKPLFHVFFYVTFLLSVTSIVLDIVVLKTNKAQPNVDDCV